MPKAVEIIILILAPLGWGLLVDFIFERLRRRRSGARCDDEAAE